MRFERADVLSVSTMPCHFDVIVSEKKKPRSGTPSREIESVAPACRHGRVDGSLAAAKAFLRKAMRSQATAPTSITLDGYAASHRAVRKLQEQDEVPKTARLRSSKYLNNVIEQDHRNIKLRLGPMLGFKRFQSAAITIAGIELMHRIRKGQFALSRLGVQGQVAPAFWEAALTA